MAKVRNIVAVVWEYEKNGETKKEYLTVGKLIEKDDWKLSVKIDCVPVWWNWWANVYDRDKKDNSSNNDWDDNPF